MSATSARTALVVVADEAQEAVAGWRRRYDPHAVERRIPPHVTVLFPLVRASEVDDDLLEKLRGLYAPVERFAYELAAIESFPGVAWLAPEPAAPLQELIALTRAAFPDHPPYGDPTLEPVPHCTIGVEPDPQRLQAIVEELRTALRPVLPIRCSARAVTLLEERPDATWASRASFGLADGR